MHSDTHFRRLIDGARQVTELPEEDAVVSEEGPLYLGWFALGHAAVLFTLALRALCALSPMEQALVWFCSIAVVGFALITLVLARMREGLALAEVVEVRMTRRTSR